MRLARRTTKKARIEIIPFFGRTETRDNMRITWHQPITMDDGLVVRADVYRPVSEEARCPVILTYGIYGKGLLYEDGYPMQWQKMVEDHPDIVLGLTSDIIPLTPTTAKKLTDEQILQTRDLQVRRALTELGLTLPPAASPAASPAAN